MNKKYLIDLTSNERTLLMEITSKGKASARKIKRANLLLMADQKQHTEKEITELLGVSTSGLIKLGAFPLRFGILQPQKANVLKNLVWVMIIFCLV